MTLQQLLLALEKAPGKCYPISPNAPDFTIWNPLQANNTVPKRWYSGSSYLNKRNIPSIPKVLRSRIRTLPRGLRVDLDSQPR